MGWECQRQKSSTPKACSLYKLNGKKQHNTTMRSSENGLTSQTVDRFQMGANILLKPAPHPDGFLPPSPDLYTAALMDWLLELLLNTVPVTRIWKQPRTGEQLAGPQPHS